MNLFILTKLTRLRVSCFHPQVVTDVDDVFIPTPEDLLCNLNECKEQVRELLLTLGKTQVG